MNNSLWKIKGVILLLLIFPLTGCFAHLKSPELNPEMAGFSGINWGASLAEVKGKIKAKGENKERNLKWFSSNGKVFLGNIPLNEVSYLFERNEFITVTGIVIG